MNKKTEKLFSQHKKKGTSYKPGWNWPKNRDHLWRLKQALKGK